MKHSLIKLSIVLVFSLFLLGLSSGCGYFSLQKNSDYKILEDRVGKLENSVREQKAQAAAPPAPRPEKKAEPVTAGPAPKPAPASPPKEKKDEIRGHMEELYPQARANYLEEKYGQAIKVFSYLLERYPDHPLSPNARYWLGECFYGLKEYDLAISEFERVVSDFPKSVKAPEAQLKIAYSHSRLGDGKKAMAVLKTLLTNYPQSPAVDMVRRGKTIFRPEDTI
ncbi:MAG: tol-pal system protein YbgF [Deltaproteobacteria bacterium]|nr:tol-pal system protein YbgF [Deltaproteobacteria bacterium]